MGTHKQIKVIQTQNTNLGALGPTGLYELVLVAVHMENETSDVQPKCLLSPPLFSHDQHHKTCSQTEAGGGASIHN